MGNQVTISKPNKAVVVSVPQISVPLASATGDFTADITTPAEYAVVTFTPTWNAITPTLWSIDFGDGESWTGTGASTTHTYVGGTYTVKLIAGSGTAGIPVKTKSNYIVVTAFDPTFGSTVVLNTWVDIHNFASLTLIDGRIDVIQDLIDAGRTFTAIGGINERPVYTKFTGAPDVPRNYEATQVGLQHLRSTSIDEFTINTGDPFHIFMLVNCVTISGNTYLVCGMGSANWFTRFTSVASIRFRTGSVNTDTGLSAGMVTSTYVTIEITKNSSDEIEIFVNGLSVGTDTGKIGAYGFGSLFGRTTSNDANTRKWIDCKIYEEVLTGANLAAVRQNYRDRLNHY